MGVLQVAPDAAAAGGPPTGRAAVARGRLLISEGTDIIEVACAPPAPGRPPAHPMEARQVRAVVSTLMSDVRIAVRTGSATVAAAAVGAGATLITDLSTARSPAAGEGSPAGRKDFQAGEGSRAGDGSPAAGDGSLAARDGSLAALAAEAGAGWVAVAGPRTRPGAAGGGGRSGSPSLVAELAGALRARVETAAATGVQEIYIDPGIGSGRSPADDLELLGGLEQLAALDRPLVVGTGDGRLIDALHAAADTATVPERPVDRPGRPRRHQQPRADTATVPERPLDGTNSDGRARGRLGGKAARHEFSGSAGAHGFDNDADGDRLEGALTMAVWAMLAGAAIVRTHDVAATVEAARTVGAKAPAGMP